MGAGDDAERGDAEERRFSTAGDDAERGDAEERRFSTAGDDAERGDAEERHLNGAGAERGDEAQPRASDDDLGIDLDSEIEGIPDIAEAAPMESEELGSVLEALLLVVDTPVTAEALASATQQPVYRIATKLQEMAEDLTARDSGIDLRKNSEGWRMYTRARFAPYVEKLLLDGARSKLTRAALETLAVVAYRQPVTRARVSAVRGVNVDAVMRTLLARGLITEAGVDDDSGATTFATTELFLERLGLTSLADLPDIAPLLPDVDTIEDLSESLDSEPRFIKLSGGQAADPALTFDVDQD
ncbi:SMC-Scp complex subunit ScpB [Mycobacterium intracellulare]|uniref:SMC-Scp complex subunit ScpB n=1 Tax=Mycobacterium intracellulare TaxID=1767 RepID=UPI00211CEE14|nr:SMC-Scp complex subunit ScpB [Mycobacterium intracellulare]